MGFNSRLATASLSACIAFFAGQGAFAAGGGADMAATVAADQHFDPKGKPPSEYTQQVLSQARKTLPFSDRKDFEEREKGFIAPMKQKKIMADAGHVAWDMEAFQFLEEDREFDSIHPSLVRKSRLNQNYGLYYPRRTRRRSTSR